MSKDIDESILDVNQRMLRARLGAVRNELEKQFNRGEKRVSLDGFIGEITYDYGIRRQSVREYLRVYESKKLIEIKDGFIKRRKQEKKKSVRTRVMNTDGPEVEEPQRLAAQAELHRAVGEVGSIAIRQAEEAG